MVYKIFPIHAFRDEVLAWAFQNSRRSYNGKFNSIIRSLILSLLMKVR